MAPSHLAAIGAAALAITVGAAEAGSPTPTDCGLLRASPTTSNRLLAKGISCQEARRLARQPESASEQHGYHCAASAIVCWKGTPRTSLAQANAYFASFAVAAVSKERTILAAARDIATRQVKQFGVHIPRTFWSARCRRAGQHPLGPRGYRCSVDYGGAYCARGALTLYQAPKRIEALHRIDLVCGD
jgi:hypothetical protein